MEQTVKCDCGFEARAEHEQGLVAAVREHAWAAHRMGLSQDEAMLLVAHADRRPTMVAGEVSTRTREEK